MSQIHWTDRRALEACQLANKLQQAPTNLYDTYYHQLGVASKSLQLMMVTNSPYRHRRLTKVRSHLKHLAEAYDHLHHPSVILEKQMERSFDLFVMTEFIYYYDRLSLKVNLSMSSPMAVTQCEILNALKKEIDRIEGAHII